MKLVQYNEYFISTVDTNGLVFLHHGHSFEYASMRFQLFKGLILWCWGRTGSGMTTFMPCLLVTRILSWWRHQIETFSALLALCVGYSPVTAEFPAQRPVTRSFDVFVDLRLNRRLRKQSRCRWFGTPSRSLWRHCNVVAMPLTAMVLAMERISGSFSCRRMDFKDPCDFSIEKWLRCKYTFIFPQHRTIQHVEGLSLRWF